MTRTCSTGLIRKDRRQSKMRKHTSRPLLREVCPMRKTVKQIPSGTRAGYSAIGVGTGGSRGRRPPNIWRGAGIWFCPPQHLAPSRENSPQMPWFKPKFCSKSDSFRGLCPLDPHKNIRQCTYLRIGVGRRPRMACRAPPILPIFLCLWTVTDGTVSVASPTDAGANNALLDNWW